MNLMQNDKQSVALTRCSERRIVGIKHELNVNEM